PMSGHSCVDNPRLPVPQQLRATVGTARAEDRLEAVQLSAVTQNVFQPGKVVIPDQHTTFTDSQRAPLPVVIDVHVDAAPIQVDPLKVPKVDWIRSRAPDPGEHLGKGDLQPQTAPAA